MKQPTRRQYLAYKLVFMEGKTEQEAGEEMGITQQAINKLLQGLYLKFPELQPEPEDPIMIRFTSDIEDKIVRKF